MPLLFLSVGIVSLGEAVYTLFPALFGK